MKKAYFLKSMLALACCASLAACSGSNDNSPAETTAAAAETTAAAAETEKETEAVGPGGAETKPGSTGPVELRIGQVEGAAHGTKCFTVATVVVDENDTVVAAYIDDYQFLDTDQIGVPNSDAFAEDGSVAEGKMLCSKRLNDDYYSEMMASAGSTVGISANFDEIQDFVAGKTISELEELAGKSADEVLDAVSGATLVDTAGYISVIVDAAKAAKENEEVIYDGDMADLLLNREEAAAHGTKCFTLASALSDGFNVVLSYVDDYQFLDTDQTGVPNSDAFAEDGSVGEGKMLCSKRVNNEYYSGAMKGAGASMEIAANFDAIQEFVNGKTVLELEELIGQYMTEEEEGTEGEEEGGADQRDALEEAEEEEVDAVSGATLVDKMNYIAAILSAVE